MIQTCNNPDFLWLAIVVLCPHSSAGPGCSGAAGAGLGLGWAGWEMGAQGDTGDTGDTAGSRPRGGFVTCRAWQCLKGHQCPRDSPGITEKQL